MLLALMLSAATGGAGQSPLVAVLEFKDEQPGIDRKTNRNGDYLADVARSAMAARSIRVMTRENLVVLLGTSGSSIADCVDKCEIETGRLVGADFVLSGNIVRFGPELRLSMRLHETRSGTLLAGDTVGGPDVRSLEAALPQALSRILARMPGAEAAPRSEEGLFQGLSLTVLGGGGAVFAVGDQVPGYEQSGSGFDTVARVGWGLGGVAAIFLEGGLGGIRFSCCSGTALHRSVGVGAQTRLASLGRANLLATLSLARTTNDAPGTGFAGLQPERRWELLPALGMELPFSPHLAVAAETMSAIALYPFGLGSLGLRAGISYR